MPVNTGKFSTPKRTVCMTKFTTDYLVKQMFAQSVKNGRLRDLAVAPHQAFTERVLCVSAHICHLSQCAVQPDLKGF